MDLTDGKNCGASDEKQVLRRWLQPDRCYVMDRWYAQFTLFNDIHRVGSSYVCCFRDNSVLGVIEEQPLSAQARAAGVVRDCIADLGLSKEPSAHPDHPVRAVCVQVQPHAERSHRQGNTGAGPCDGMLRIAIDLLDVPAEVVPLTYQYPLHHRAVLPFLQARLGLPQAAELQPARACPTAVC